MASAIVPILLAVGGVVLYALASNPKMARIGEIVFFCGLFWTVYLLMGKAIRIG